MSKSNVIESVERIIQLNNTDLVRKIKEMVFKDPNFDLNSFIDIARDKELEHKIRLSCWYGVYVYYRRLKVSEHKVSPWVKEFEDTFSTEELFFIAKALVLVKLNDYSAALKFAEKAIELERENLGFIATYVSIALDWLEAELENKSNDSSKSVWMKISQHILFLIKQDYDYAKYHYYYSRLLILKKDIVNAEYEIELAIDLENEGTSDYMLRIADYQAHQLRLKSIALEYKLNDKFSEIESLQSELKSEQSSFEEKVKSIQNDFKESQKQGMQLITVFIAVISIILTSFNGFNFDNVEHLIIFELTLVISLLIFFGSLFYWISNPKALRLFLVTVSLALSSFIIFVLIKFVI